MAPPRSARSRESAALFGSLGEPTYPYGAPSVESEGQNTPLGETYPHQDVGPTTSLQDQDKGLVFRPQMTVNVYNTGVPGAGAGGNVTVSSGDTKGVDDTVSKLAAQVASLLQKVGEMEGELKDQRALQARSMPVTEVGTWTAHRNPPRPVKEEYIVFEKHFESTPKVAVSIRGVDASNKSNCRITAYATDVSTKGFILHVDTWGDTILHACDASWIATSG